MSEKVVDFMPETGFNEIAMDFMHETGVVGREEREIVREKEREKERKREREREREKERGHDHAGTPQWAGLFCLHMIGSASELASVRDDVICKR